MIIKLFFCKKPYLCLLQTVLKKDFPYNQILSSLFLEAIISGERDPEKLYLLTNYNRLKSSKSEIIRALTGNWREDSLFYLTAEYNMYLHYAEKIAELDVKIDDYLKNQSELKKS